MNRKGLIIISFNTTYRFSGHAVITDSENRVLQLKQTYTDKRWGLPGGGIEPGETIYEALERECLEELGIKVEIVSLTGVYYHRSYNAQVCIFKCKINDKDVITLSEEHSEYKWFEVEELSKVQQIRVNDAIKFDGVIKSRVF